MTSKSFVDTFFMNSHPRSRTDVSRRILRHRILPFYPKSVLSSPSSSKAFYNVDVHPKQKESWPSPSTKVSWHLSQPSLRLSSSFPSVVPCPTLSLNLSSILWSPWTWASSREETVVQQSHSLDRHPGPPSRDTRGPYDKGNILLQVSFLPSSTSRVRTF